MDLVWSIMIVASVWVAYFLLQNIRSQKSTIAQTGFAMQRTKSSAQRVKIFPALMKMLKSQRPKQTSSEDYIIINLFATNDRPYASYDLLNALSDASLHYGARQIFHRHSVSRTGKILFSVASIVNPGTFDIEKMGSFTTPGLTLFADLSTADDPLYTYDLMLDTADKLVTKLGGEVYEADRKTLLTLDSVNKTRSRLTADKYPG